MPKISIRDLLLAEVDIGELDIRPASSPAEFSVDGPPVEDGDYIVREGKIFQIGDYPDKGFSLTESEADEALAAFAPVPLNLEHRSTVLSGKLGQLVETVRRGGDLIGRIRIPKWLDAAIGPDPVKVSAEWTQGEKRLQGLALCLSPRIADAAMAAFTAAEAAPAAPETPAPADLRTGRAAMNRTILDRLRVLFGKITEDLEAIETTETEETPAQETPAGDPPAEFAAQTTDHQAEIARLQAEIAERDEARVKDAAAAFAAGLVQRGKALPAEAESIAALFAHVAASDAAGGAALFNDDGPAGDGIARLKAAYEARPAHDLTAERLKSESAAGVVFTGDSTGADGQPDPARIRELLAMTPLGQKILKETK
jgi:hypothetical protein